MTACAHNYVHLTDKDGKTVHVCTKCGDTYIT